MCTTEIPQVLSEFDIFSVVGANKPLQLVDLRVSVKDDRAISVRFEGVIGSPIISGIGIRRASNVSGSLDPDSLTSQELSFFFIIYLNLTLFLY